MIEVLTPAEMARADAVTIAMGRSGLDLMEAAGGAVADVVLRTYPQARNVLVLCGSGNNGGDGFVVARRLAQAGMAVRVMGLAPKDQMAGDAALVAASWPGPVDNLSPDIGRPDLVIDALLGAGLARDVTSTLAEVIGAVTGAGIPVVAVDLPSGIDGTSGAVRGCAFQAHHTVTFARLKPGHLLLPGRAFCGHRHLMDIGISDDTIASIGTKVFANRPQLWLDHLPRAAAAEHKYTRGHVGVITGAATSTGAARLAIRAAFRAGAGLVTAIAAADAAPVLAAALEGPMLQIADSPEGLCRLIGERKISCVVAGPGGGVGAMTREKVLAALSQDVDAVLDADALTSFAACAGDLMTCLRERGREAVLTPHTGEFGRLFDEVLGQIAGTSKLELALQAARLSGAVVLIKGADTVVASPDGRASIADNAPPWLATAGAGDVLAGMIAGLLAQGMPAFEAASGAVWMHGTAAANFGPGLVAEDLPDCLPAVLRPLHESLSPWSYHDPLGAD
jgi:hydroxyethylthiazole kinase-like uncharacterized protein yjeF